MEDDIKDEGLTEEGTTEESTVESSETTETPAESTEDAGYQFDDDLTSSEPPAASAPKAPQSSGGGGFAQELFSKTIHAKFRTFYVDLKESKNGKFVKISEKSRGRKSTIMMDQEDVPAIIEALQEVQKQF